MRAGFSLVEILFYLLVVFALTVILLSASGTLRKTRSSNLEAIATNIASCEIERLRTLDFNTASEFNSGLGTAVAIPAPCNQDLNILPSSSATRTVSNYTGDTSIKLVKLDVNWTENSIANSISEQTLISKYGL